MLRHFPRVDRIRKALSSPLPGSRKPVTHTPAWPLLLLFGTLVFFSALSGGVIAPDDEMHLSDPAIGETTCLGERITWILRSTHLSGYHPLQRIGYWIQRTLWNGDPMMFHIVSLVLHGAASLLAYALALRLKLGWQAALLAGLVFVVHPTRAEAVAWISAQRHLGAAIFMLLALSAYAPILTGEARRRGWRLLLVGALLLPALLFDSTAVAVPLLLLVLDVAWRRPPRSALPEKIPFLAVSALFLALAPGAAPGPEALGASWETHAATALLAPWWCTGRILWPMEYSAHWWGPQPVSLFSTGALSGGIFLMACAVVLVFSLPRSWRGAAWLTLGWPAACLLGALLPSAASRAVLADRHLYLPLLGPSLVLASWWCGETSTRGLMAARPRLRLAGIVALGIALGVPAHIHATAFRDTETLWRRSLEAQPESPVARRSLADLLVSRDPDALRADEALSLLERPDNHARDDQLYRLTRCRVYRFLGRHPEADGELEAAVRLGHEQHPLIETTLEHSKWLATRGRFQEAHAALEILPARGSCQELQLLEGHASVCLGAGDLAGYLLWNEKLLTRSPFDLILWYNRERVARLLGDDDEARRAGARFEELCPPAARPLHAATAP